LLFTFIPGLICIYFKGITLEGENEPAEPEDNEVAAGVRLAYTVPAPSNESEEASVQVSETSLEELMKQMKSM
jgi:hypothetical protein